jgi:hypothetical protein
LNFKVKKTLAFSLVTLFFFSLVFGLSNVSRVSALTTPGSSNSIFLEMTTAVVPNNGLEIYTETVVEPTRDFVAVWTSETMDNNIWIQIGYTIENDLLQPFLMIINGNIMSTYNPRNSALYVGWFDTDLSFVSGTYHLFRMVFTSSSEITFSVDGNVILVATPAFFNNLYIQQGHPEYANIASFATTASQGLIMTTIEGNNCNITNPIDIPIAIAYLQNNNWYIPYYCIAAGSVDNVVSVEGQIQNPSLKFGEVVASFQYSYIGSRIWYGNTTLVDSSNVVTPTSTPTPYVLNKTDLILFGLIIGATIAVLVAVGTFFKHPKHKHR